MTFAPEMGTYVDSDVAAQLGLGRSSVATTPEADAQAWAAHSSPEQHADQQTKPWTDSELEEPELSGDDLEALQDEIDRQNDEAEPALSETYGEIARCFSPEEFTSNVEGMIAGDFEGTLDRVSQATGLDRQSAPTSSRLLSLRRLPTPRRKSAANAGRRCCTRQPALPTQSQGGS